MCDARLSVSYEYKDNNRDSLKIKNINIKKDHSIEREDIIILWMKISKKYMTLIQQF